MASEQHEFWIFVRYFTRYSYLVRHTILALLLHILAGGLLISYLEDLKISEATYFAFVTGLTIGYGDIEPVTTAGRVVSVAIGLVGMLFTGTCVAISTRALADTVKQISDNESA